VVECEVCNRECLGSNPGHGGLPSWIVFEKEDFTSSM